MPAIRCRHRNIVRWRSVGPNVPPNISIQLDAWHIAVYQLHRIKRGPPIFIRFPSIQKPNRMIRIRPASIRIGNNWVMSFSVGGKRRSRTIGICLTISSLSVLIAVLYYFNFWIFFRSLFTFHQITCESCVRFWPMQFFNPFLYRSK